MLGNLNNFFRPNTNEAIHSIKDCSKPKLDTYETEKRSEDKPEIYSLKDVSSNVSIQRRKRPLDFVHHDLINNLNDKKLSAVFKREKILFEVNNQYEEKYTLCISLSQENAKAISQIEEIVKKEFPNKNLNSKVKPFENKFKMNVNLQKKYKKFCINIFNKDKKHIYGDLLENSLTNPNQFLKPGSKISGVLKFFGVWESENQVGLVIHLDQASVEIECLVAANDFDFDDHFDDDSDEEDLKLRTVENRKGVF